MMDTIIWFLVNVTYTFCIVWDRSNKIQVFSITLTVQFWFFFRSLSSMKYFFFPIRWRILFICKFRAIQFFILTLKNHLNFTRVIVLNHLLKRNKYIITMGNNYFNCYIERFDCALWYLNSFNVLILNANDVMKCVYARIALLNNNLIPYYYKQMENNNNKADNLFFSSAIKTCTNHKTKRIYSAISFYLSKMQSKLFALYTANFSRICSEWQS